MFTAASMPIATRTIARSVETVREGAVEAGRDPHTLRILVRVVPELWDDDAGPERRPFQGSRAQILADLERLAVDGATEVLLDLNLSPRVGGRSGPLG
jgi:alkanesulfonate monooxygenase SsuD/methylene tetrahydromethanopterin reductase-like flavin-dependent oxidoreductase (luciferase family)